MPIGLLASFALAKVALAAELRRGRRIRVGDVVDVRIVGTIHEEEGGVEFPPPSSAIGLFALDAYTVMTCWLWQVVQST